MRPVALTWVLQKNGLASSKGDAQRAIIINGKVMVNGSRVTDPALRLDAGDYLLQRNGSGNDGEEVRVKVGQ
jgi:ribosomal protein S4